MSAPHAAPGQDLPPTVAGQISPWAWVPSLYFVQGLPYVVVMTLSVVLYKNLGLSNTDIALYTSWLYLPWVIKPLWSPLVELMGTKRLWVVALQFAIGAALAMVALTLPMSRFFQLSLAVFWLMAFASASHDIAADGLNSRLRQKYAQTYQPDVDLRQCRFVWLGTTKLFDAFTFDFQKTEWGWFQAHAYRFDGETSTFIVETPEAVWQAAGLAEMSKEDSIAFCERLFARVLDGHKLISNAGRVPSKALVRASHLRGSWLQRLALMLRRL